MDLYGDEVFVFTRKGRGFVQKLSFAKGHGIGAAFIHIGQDASVSARKLNSKNVRKAQTETEQQRQVEIMTSNTQTPSRTGEHRDDFHQSAHQDRAGSQREMKGWHASTLLPRRHWRRKFKNRKLEYDEATMMPHQAFGLQECDLSFISKIA